MSPIVNMSPILNMSPIVTRIVSQVFSNVSLTSQLLYKETMALTFGEFFPDLVESADFLERLHLKVRRERARAKARARAIERETGGGWRGREGEKDRKGEIRTNEYVLACAYIHVILLGTHRVCSR
jgi:hypothetical protein